MFRQAAYAAATAAVLVVLAAPAFAKTNQVRSDRVVGEWRSTSGSRLDLMYSGNPRTIYVQVYQGRGDSINYVAQWTSDTTFQYLINGETVVATYDPRTTSISARTRAGDWSAKWRLLKKW